MQYCDKQTYKDLELDAIILQLTNYCKGPTALSRINNLHPIENKEELMQQLQKVNELLNIRNEGLTFPHLDFEELTTEIKLLPKKNASLPQESFVKIKDASSLVNRLLYFFDKREQEYPQLFSIFSETYYTKELIELIDKVFDKRGKVKDDASVLLFQIRQKIKAVQNQINRNFEKELRKWLKAGYLSDTKESYLDNKRLLAVNSTFKRQIGGSVAGGSKSGNVTYIEPASNLLLNTELEQLFDDERREIFIILQQLTKDCVVFLPLINSYQNALTSLDYINASCRLALNMDAVLPAIHTTEKKFELIDAFHPILKLKNSEIGKKTIPQYITMDKFSRMLVISGPNAGGKSITLKTVGLLQLMLQCGLLVPVHPNSKMCFFETLLTDIGDNQSIENELSTYSYRLKRMKFFLEVANKNSLLLLDEFGTGSDPDLGGALAEVFFETLYNKKAYGVITTHYGNIKLKADQLQNAVNGCMLFDAETLQPLYKFSIGQPGSSFTFEVAQINGIPLNLIEKAKGKLDHKKVKMDKLLAELQKEKSYLSKLNKAHVEAQEIAEKARLSYEAKEKQFQQKLTTIKERAEQDDKFITLGKKLQNFIDQYKPRGKAKNLNQDLLLEVKKYIAVEKAKIEEAKQSIILAKKAKAKKKKNIVIKDEYQQSKIKIGSAVKMIATKQKGIVEEMNGDDITVAFGYMRMKVKKQKLMWVE